MNPEAYIEMSQTESKHWWFTGRREILLNTLKKLKLPQDAKILEIGCGTGGNLQMLARFGEVSALEMDSNARKIASEKTDNQYTIKAGYCPDEIPYEKQSFDLICMFDVLEHIEQDSETLSAIKMLLKKDGKIFLTVPAYQWLWGTHDEFLHHKRRYTARRLSEIIKTSGLKPLRISYFNTILFPFAAIVRLKDRLLGNKNATGTNIPPKAINKLFKTLFSSERYLLQYINLPFGVSLLCILCTPDEQE